MFIADVYERDSSLFRREYKDTQNKADITSLGALLPSKANPTQAQTMEYFQWDNERPGFCVNNLVTFQQSYHLLSDVISDHSEYAIHPSHSQASG